jgi:aryl-alcohol dehydrogenase-like predicted oxidoreductase
MELRPLGATGLQVSPVGLGTVKIGRNQGVKYPKGFELPSDQDVRELLDTARDLGVNLLDTAPAYGTSEQRLGPLIRDDRDRWVIVTKVGELFNDGVSTFNFAPEAVQASVYNSVARLQAEPLDCVLVHSDGRDEHIIRNLGTLDALRDLKDQGVIRSFGMSTKTLAGALIAVDCCDVLMLTYNPTEAGDGEAIDEASARNVGVLIKKGFASGHLDRIATAIHDDAGDPVEHAMRFIFQRPGVSSVITGTLNPDHLRQNVAATERALA